MKIFFYKKEDRIATEEAHTVKVCIKLHNYMTVYICTDFWRKNNV